MRKRILNVFLALILTILQFSLYSEGIKINLLLLFLIYLLFFEGINEALIVISFGILADLFAINFGSYFVSFLLVAIILHYIRHNILGNNKLAVYLLINFIGLIIFYIVYYIYNFFVVIFNSGFYYFNWGFIFKEFFVNASIYLFCCLIIYAVINIFSYRIRKKFTIIGS